jgi:hypothetical protein
MALLLGRWPLSLHIQRWPRLPETCQADSRPPRLAHSVVNCPQSRHRLSGTTYWLVAIIHPICKSVDHAACHEHASQVFQLHAR